MPERTDLEEQQFELKSTMHQSDLLPGIVKEEHLQTNIHAVRFGLAADRPSGSTHTKIYFATDTGVISAWNGSAWVSTTLS